jgi:Na+/glutamate symporter
MSKIIWFKKIGWFYLPASIIGGIITLLFGVLLATVIIAANRNVHSVSDMMYGIFPYAVCCFYLVNWIGRNTSE